MFFKDVLAQRKIYGQTPSDPWRQELEKLSGTTGLSKIERVPTDREFDVLGLTKHERTPAAAKRLEEVLTSLGWFYRCARLISQAGDGQRVCGVMLGKRK
jgi:hypothetical protein